MYLIICITGENELHTYSLILPKLQYQQCHPIPSQEEKMNWLGIIAMLLSIVSLILLITSTTEKDEVNKQNFDLPLFRFIIRYCRSCLNRIGI